VCVCVCVCLLRQSGHVRALSVRDKTVVATHALNNTPKAVSVGHTQMECVCVCVCVCWEWSHTEDMRAAEEPEDPPRRPERNMSSPAASESACPKTQVQHEHARALTLLTRANIFMTVKVSL